MEQEAQVLTVAEHALTSREYRFLICWSVSLLLLYAIGGYLGTRLLRSYTAETARTRAAWLETPIMGMAPTSTGGVLPSSVKPTDVIVNMSMNRVGEFALKESAWTADFDIDFRWTGDGVNPGENFRIANGQILQREKGKSYKRGEERRAGYHVVARMSKPYDASRFPFSDEGLVVQVEDSTQGSDGLRYIADQGNSGAGPESTPRNVTLAWTTTGVKLRHRGPAQTDPKARISAEDAYSQFYFAMLVVPGSLGIYLKLFQALFASVALTLIALYIKPTHVDCRFGLPVGGFFASVSNNIFLGTLLPSADRLTLTDMINTVSLLTIFFVLTQSVISLHIFDTKGRERFSRYFDMVSLVVLAIGYVGVNIALPFAARPN